MMEAGIKSGTASIFNWFYIAEIFNLYVGKTGGNLIKLSFTISLSMFVCFSFSFFFYPIPNFS